MRHHRQAPALVVAGVAEHVAYGVDLLGVLEPGLGDELGPQRVAGHEDGFGKVAGLGVEVGGGHVLALVVGNW